MESVTVVTDCYRAGNTIPPGKLVGKKRKITDVTDVTDVTGKIKRNPAFHWIFVWNNYPTNWKDFFEDRRGLIEKIYASQEVSSTGTPHIQGWLKLCKKNEAKKYLHLPDTIHWECMYKNATEKANTKYCAKEKGTFLTWGVKLPYTIDVPKKPWMIELENILRGPEEHRLIHWIWEPEGCTMKTVFAKMMVLELEHVIVINGKGNDIRHCVAEYLNKNGVHPKVIMMNVPRVNNDFISYEAIENVKDMLFYSGKYEGTMICGPNPHVLILANDRPETYKMSNDRWKIGRLVEENIIWE